MALSNYSKFYYGWKITIDNQYLDFTTASGAKTAILSIGNYSTQGLAIEIKKQMDAVQNDLDFTVTYDRTTRKFDIVSTAIFSLDLASGASIFQSAFPLLGFVGADRTGATAYVGNLISGIEYKPQFKLQSYIPTSINRKSIDAVVNKSASGAFEVIKFGNERFMTCEIKFITDIVQEFGSVIRTNTSAVSEFISFIEWATDKGTIEFMENENIVDNFQILVLESTVENQNGLDYELKELYSQGLSGYFESGSLKFKLLEV